MSLPPHPHPRGARKRRLYMDFDVRGRRIVSRRGRDAFDAGVDMVVDVRGWGVVPSAGGARSVPVSPVGQTGVEVSLVGTRRGGALEPRLTLKTLSPSKTAIGEPQGHGNGVVGDRA